MPRKSHENPEPRYWLYRIGDAWSVYAGKTDEDNDLLSLHFAHPDDYWFHVKGALIGMAFGIPAALAAGLVVIVL